MQISVVHSTVYRYEGAVFQEPHTFRLRPREDGAQHLLQYALEITPAPAGSTQCLDQDGNVVMEAWFHQPVEMLHVRSAFQIETLRHNPFDFLLSPPELANLPLVYPEPWRSPLSPSLRPGQDGAVIEFARSLAEQAGWKTLVFLTVLNRTLFEGHRHIVRDGGPPFSPELTLRQREGSCRDLAVLFCSACWSLGIAARFVSGYEQEAAVHEQAYMHAWAEVYLPGGGWRGYDPSQGLAVSTSHVAVAASAQPQLAAPISGSYRGSAGSRMEFQISMAVQGAAGH